MFDVAEQLERYADRVAAEVDVVTADEIVNGRQIARVSALPEAESQASTRRLRRRLVAGIAAAALLLVGMVAVVDDDQPSDMVTTDDAPIPEEVADDITPPPDSDSEGWQQLAPGPLEPRQGAAVVWAGGELIVLAGERRSDGAAYDPAAGEWRTIADTPFGAGVVDAVWTGSEVFVMGPSEQDASERRTASYDPVSDTWQELAPAPNVGDPYRDGLLVFGANVVAPWIPAIYDATTSTWEELPEAASRHDSAGVVADGRLVLADHGFDTLVVDIESRDVVSWAGPPDHGLNMGAEGVAAVESDDSMVLVDDNGRVSTLDLSTGTWEEEHHLGAPARICVPEAGVLDDGRSYWDMCDRIEIRTADGVWRQTLPGGPLRCCYPTTATDGAAIYSWVSNDDTLNDPSAPYNTLWVWVPPTAPLAEGPSSSAFDATSLEWIASPSVPTREDEEVVATTSGVVVWTNDGANHGSVYQDGRWTTMADSPLPSVRHPTISETPDGLVIGGGILDGFEQSDSYAIYEPETNTWSPLPSPPRTLAPRPVDDGALPPGGVGAVAATRVPEGAQHQSALLRRQDRPGRRHAAQYRSGRLDPSGLGVRCDEAEAKAVPIAIMPKRTWGSPLRGNLERVG